MHICCCYNTITYHSSHYNDVIMSAMASQITRLAICLLNCLFSRRSKNTSKLRVTGLVMGIHRWPVNSPHKGPVTWKMFPSDDVIMIVKFMDHFVYAPSQWEATLQRNVASHWLDAYTKWSLEVMQYVYPCSSGLHPWHWDNLMINTSYLDFIVCFLWSF